LSKVYAFPKESDEYLERRYNIRRYSHRHTIKLVRAGIYPEPFEISPRRKALTESQLDAYAQGILARAEN
jgi:hypothetical protein